MSGQGSFRQQNRSSKEMTDWDNGQMAQDAELNEALRNFRMSVHAWSDAAMSRPRAVVAATSRTVWRAAAGWSLGCVLVAGIAAGGFVQHQRSVEQQKAAEQQRRIQQQLAAHMNEDSDTLLAHVDSAVSREVPAAMDPLASLVGEE